MAIKDIDRLTHKRVNGIKTGYWSAASKEAVVQRLAEYENTGFTPAGIDALRKEMPAPAWTPCSERPPEDGQDILAYLVNEHEARIVPANYDHGTWYDCIFNKLIPADQITHWMPSPKPPAQ